MTATILPIGRNTCRGCLGIGERNGRTCRECYGSGVRNVDAATKEHWGYRDGIAAHRVGRKHDSCLFANGSFAHRCWLAGWAQSERAAIAADRAEKIEAEQLGAGDWVDRCGARAIR